MNIKFISFLFSILLLTISCNSQNAAQALNPVAFSEKMKTSPDAVVLDVRTPGEFSGGFIAKATNVNFSDADFKSEISKLDKNKTYLVYCLSEREAELLQVICEVLIQRCHQSGRWNFSMAK